MILRTVTLIFRSLVVLVPFVLVSCGDEGPSEKDEFPLFDLERGEICASWCDRFAECLPDEYENTSSWPYGERSECIAGCQENLDTAWATTSREDCGRAIDSLYACQGAVDCHEFEAGYRPSVDPIACEAVDTKYYELCIL